MKRTIMLPASVVFASLALMGCAPSVPVGQQSESGEKPTPTASSEPTSSPSPTARGADTRLEAIDAYALCKAQTVAYFPGDFSRISWDPFESATWLLRDDGAIGIYIEATDANNAAGSAGRDVALSCKVGGTLGEPVWHGFGVRMREADRNVVLDILASTDQS